MSIQDLLQSCIDLKSGNKELALFYDGEGTWSAAIGNECPMVGLGESCGEHSADGDTPEEALANLEKVLKFSIPTVIYGTITGYLLSEER